MTFRLTQMFRVLFGSNQLIYAYAYMVNERYIPAIDIHRSIIFMCDINLFVIW